MRGRMCLLRHLDVINEIKMHHDSLTKSSVFFFSEVITFTGLPDYLRARMKLQVAFVQSLCRSRSECLKGNAQILFSQWR